MVEQRLEWESKNPEMVQYIGIGKVETEIRIEIGNGVQEN